MMGEIATQQSSEGSNKAFTSDSIHGLALEYGKGPTSLLTSGLPVFGCAAFIGSAAYSWQVSRTEQDFRAKNLRPMMGLLTMSQRRQK